MLRLALAIPYILLIAAGGSLWLAGRHRRRRGQPEAAWLARCLESCAVWMVLDAASFLVPDPFLQELARQAVWPVVVLVNLSFFRFACAHARQPGWWRAVRVPLLAAVAVEVVIMVTNSSHQLMWLASEWIDLGPTRIPALQPGAAFYWLHLPICYGLFLGGVLALLVRTAESQAAQARRLLALIAAMLVPFAVNVIVVNRVTNGIDLTPLAVVLSIVVAGEVTLRRRLLDVMPAAGSQLFHQYRDGVVVVDTNSRIVDANPAAGRMLGRGVNPGTPVTSALPFWERIRDMEDPGPAGRIEIAHGDTMIEARSLVVCGERGEAIGRIVVLHDVTERARLVRELSAYARTIAHDLKNPLSGMIGYLDLARVDQPDLDPESEQLLTEARDVCLGMADIIADLLRTRPAAASEDDCPR